MRSAYTSRDFKNAKKDLEDAGYGIVSLEQMAQLSIQEGKDSFIAKNGNWTREGFIYIPKKGAFLTKNSPIMTSVEEASNCVDYHKQFYPTSEQVEKALEDSCKITNKVIPTSRLAEEELTVYAFGKQAKNYGEFLKEAGIKNLNIYTANMQDKPFAMQAWLGLERNFYLNGHGRGRGGRGYSGGLAWEQVARGTKIK